MVGGEWCHGLAEYAALLRLGPSTGSAVARACHVARANAYGALEGLVHQGAAARVAGRPARCRPTDTVTLLAGLAGLWSSHPLIVRLAGAALDRLA